MNNNPNINILEHYKKGGNRPNSNVGRDMMRNYTDWIEKLKREYYEKGNRVGRNLMFAKLKNDYPGQFNHPTKRFVMAWLKNQVSNQLFQRARKAKRIQAVITDYPNDLMQVDYIYFLSGKKYVVRENSKPDKMNTKEEEAWLENEELYEKGEAKIKKKKLDKVVYRGAITAIDVFSRRLYARAVKGNINSQKAIDVFLNDPNSIVDEAEQHVASKPYFQFKKTHPTLNRHKLSRIQTDKGSEFMLNFRNGLTRASEETGKKSYRHRFGYEGKSQAQGVVERANGTLKKIIIQLITGPTGELRLTEWHNYLEPAVRIYNDNIHSTIQRSPNSVGDLPDDLKTVKKSVLTYAKKHKSFTTQLLKKGDYVRVFNYNHKKKEPSYTFKGGPLIEMGNHNNDKFAGVFMVHKVNKGHHNKIGKSTTYTIVAVWVKEKILQPSAIKNNRNEFGAEPITVNDPNSMFNGILYPAGAYERKFLIEELIKIEKDEKQKPIVESDINSVKIIPVVEEAPEPTRASDRTVEPPERLGFENEDEDDGAYAIDSFLEVDGDRVKVLWELGDSTWEDMKVLQETSGMSNREMKNLLSGVPGYYTKK